MIDVLKKPACIKLCRACIFLFKLGAGLPLTAIALPQGIQAAASIIWIMGGRSEVKIHAIRTTVIKLPLKRI